MIQAELERLPANIESTYQPAPSAKASSVQPYALSGRSLRGKIE